EPDHAEAPLPGRLPRRANHLRRARRPRPRGAEALHRLHDRGRLRRPRHPRQFLRAVPPGRRRAGAAHAPHPRSCRRARAGDRDDDAHLAADLRRALPPRAGGGCGHGDGDATLSRRQHPLPGGGDPRLLPDRLRCDRHPDHDPGCAGRGHSALGALPRPHGAGDRACRLLQDRGALRRRQAARARRPRRRSGRGALGRRGGDHADGRPRGRGHRLHDRRRLPGRHPPGHRCLVRRPARRGGGGLSALAAADQLREPAMRAGGGQGVDAGGRHHRLRRPARAARPAASGNTGRPDRAGPALRRHGPALGAV
ncbi:MAG: L-2-keto-3-deoxyarabonate dehydratase, partial [uncultured Craurococcus sp.]